MTEPTQTEDRTTSPRSIRVRLPGFIREEKEVGLGDAIKRVTYAFGLQACGGCEQRAVTLNRWMVFTRKR
jgi:hypothetical protein